MRKMLNSNLKCFMLNNSKGSVIISVSIVVSIIFTMIAVLLMITTTDIKMSKSYGDGQRAYYLAETGIAYGIKYAVENKGVILGYFQNYSNPFTEYAKDHSITFGVDGDGIYDIYAEGVCGSSRKKINARINVGSNGKAMILSWQQEY